MTTIQPLFFLAAAAALLCSNSPLRAETVAPEAGLGQMRQQLAQLEDRVEARRERAVVIETGDSGSGLSSLLENTDIAGWVAASYAYNFEGSHNGSTATASPKQPFHMASNTVQVDQV